MTPSAPELTPEPSSDANPEPASATPAEIPLTPIETSAPVATPVPAPLVVAAPIPAPAPARIKRPLEPREVADSLVVDQLPAEQARPTRLVSLDALRGFDMFWIIGAEEVVHAVAKVWPNHWAKLASDQLEHTPWAGFTFYDLIFPMFVFIVGVSLVFSLSKAITTRSKFVAVRRVILRGVFLYLIGLILYGGLSNSFGGLYAQHKHPLPAPVDSPFMRVITDIRLIGVLQRIAISYLVAGLLFIFFRPRVLVGIAVGLLGVYWALMTFVHAPGQDHVSFENGKNLANWIDAHYLPGYTWGNEVRGQKDFDYDPEGLLSTIPAIAGCLLGVFAGLLLQTPRFGPYQKFGLLFLAGAIAIGLGYSWGFQFPIIKKLWTSSFVLLTSGCAAILLSLFYLVIDVWRFRIWAAPFVWIGMNAITLYLVWNLFDFTKLAYRIVGGPNSELSHHVPKGFTDLAPHVLALFFILTLARFLYKRQIFLRV
jgi:predicted acyltransferase